MTDHVAREVIRVLLDKVRALEARPIGVQGAAGPPGAGFDPDVAAPYITLTADDATDHKLSIVKDAESNTYTTQVVQTPS